MNRRQRMYASNYKARTYILEVMKGSHVYFKEHLKRKSRFFNLDSDGKEVKYLATDFFNLFDGLCFIDGSLCFFQIKTNAWPSSTELDNFLNDKHGFGVFAINVLPKKRQLKLRWYTLTMEAR